MDEAIDVEVVEEALDIKEDGGCTPPCTDGAFGLVNKAHGRVDRRVVVSRSKLVGGEEGEEVGV